MADAQVEVTPLTATLEESTAKSHGADSSAFNRMKMLGNLGDKYFLDDPAYITQLEFFKQATKIEDPLELKRYILRYAQEAYTIFPYPCIWGLTFCCGKVASHPVYTHVLELGKVTEGDHQPIFLDIGTFFGTDIQQLVSAGYNEKSVLGVDLVSDWIRLGRQFFRNRQLPMLSGQILDPDFLDLSQAGPRAPITIDDPIDLSSVDRLTTLVGTVRAITANSLFHLFDEPTQFELARRMAHLIDRKPGSVIFGSHIGFKERGTRTNWGERGLFGHSPESWTEMWHQILPETELKIEANLSESKSIHYIDQMEGTFYLTWSVVFM